MSTIQIFESQAAAIRVYLSKAKPRSTGLFHVQTAYQYALENNVRAMNASLNCAIREAYTAETQALPRSDEKRNAMAVHRALVRLQVICKQEY